MDEKVTFLPIHTNLPVPPDRVLTAAVEELDQVFVVGRKHDGSFYFAGSTSDFKEMLYYLTLALRATKNMMEEEEFDG